MIIELITPLVIASAPMAVTVESGQYNHATQSAPVETTTNYTSSGTQTFDINGKPRDSDND